MQSLRIQSKQVKLKIVFLIILIIFCHTALAQKTCSPVFINPQKKFQHNTAQHPRDSFNLQIGNAISEIKYTPRGQNEVLNLDDFLKKFCTTGLLIMKGDAVIFERYLQGVTANDHLLSASMSKTILSLLYGIAIKENKIALSDKVSDILPDFSSSAFNNSTVEDLLRMASGVKLVNSHERGARADNQAVNPIVSPKQNVRDFLKEKKLSAAPTGTSFDYNGAQTALLGLMLRERIGMKLTEYLEKKLWKPMGAQSDAYWLTNRFGEEGVQGHFAATLRDYGRLGYLILRNGMIGANQIVPASWIEEMTSLKRDKPQPQKGPPFYGLHVWLLSSPVRHIALEGTNGQRMHIVSTADLVIVHTGNSIKAEFDGRDHLRPLTDSIIKSMLLK